MGGMIYVVGHFIVYTLWRVLAEGERKSRPDGKHIPHYATGGPGNAIGFTLVAFALGASNPFPSFLEAGFALIIGVLLAALLHFMWQRAAKEKTVSLYLRTGSATPAGIVHLFYIVLVTSLVVLTVVSWADLTSQLKVVSASGFIFYACTVCWDRWRRVI